MRHRAAHGTCVGRVALGCVAAAAATTLLLSGCGGEDSEGVATAQQGQTSAAASAGTGNEVADYIAKVRVWVDCMRNEGIDVSDPDETGQTTINGDLAALKQDPTFTKAQQQCQSLLPAVPQSVMDLRRTQLTDAQKETNRKYAECMQTHGAPDFPDPDADGGFDRSGTWDQSSAGARQATEACASILGVTPGPTQG